MTSSDDSLAAGVVSGPDAIAGAAVFLPPPSAAGVHGTTLDVDGGLSAARIS